MIFLLYFRFFRLIQHIVLFLVNPLAMLYYCCFLHYYATTTIKSTTSIIDLCINSWSSTQHALLTSVMDSYLYDSWTYTLIATGFFPVWIMLWALLFLNPKKVNKENGESPKKSPSKEAKKDQ